MMTALRDLIRFLRENDRRTILAALHRRDVHPVIQFFKYAVSGVAALWIMSAFGGIGGSTGRSMWWALVLLPYPIGWMLGLVEGYRHLREHARG